MCERHRTHTESKTAPAVGAGRIVQLLPTAVIMGKARVASLMTKAGADFILISFTVADQI